MHLCMNMYEVSHRWLLRHGQPLDRQHGWPLHSATAKSESISPFVLCTQQHRHDITAHRDALISFRLFNVFYCRAFPFRSVGHWDVHCLARQYVLQINWILWRRSHEILRRIDCPFLWCGWTGPTRLFRSSKQKSGIVAIQKNGRSKESNVFDTAQCRHLWPERNARVINFV